MATTVSIPDARPTPSSLSEYEPQIGPKRNLYFCVKGKPHIMYSLAAFQQLIAEGKIK